jgi:DNA-binding beta-propeller fold protein YncE
MFEDSWGRLPAGANGSFGITLDPKRTVLYTGSRPGRKIFRIPLDNPTATALADAEAGVNGVTLHENGDVYYTDQGPDGQPMPMGNVYRVTPDGVKTAVTKTRLQEPNGLAFAPDGKLYVLGWRTGDITALVVKDGVEESRAAFVKLPSANADGIGFDSKGNLYATASGRLYRVTPDKMATQVPGQASGANLDFGAGMLSCKDIYMVGPLRRISVQEEGLDVPWHRTPE